MSQYIPLNLACISYEPAEGVDETLPPVIFLHGITASKEMWLDIPQNVANKTKRKVYAVDARNHGDTEWTDEFNFEINVDDLLHFMDTISAPKAVLVGHSMGGITSIRAALKNPERIEMVFIEDMCVKNLDQEVLDGVVKRRSLFNAAVRQLPVDCPEKDVFHEVMKFVNERLPEEAREIIPPALMEKLQLPIRKDANGRYQPKANMDVLLKAVENGKNTLSEAKGLYEGPAYFIYGKLSPFKVYEDEDNIRAFFPKAELIGVEKADHNVHVPFSELFTDIVVKNILKH